jgi:hypothetical protein
VRRRSATNANGSEPISSPAATNRNTFRAPQSSSSGPAISSAAGPASSARVQHSRHHLGSERLGRACRDHADQRSIDKGTEERRGEEHRHHADDGKVEPEQPERQRESDERDCAEPDRVELGDDADRRDASEYRAGAEGREQRAGDLRAAVELLVGEHGQPGDEHLAEAVEQERRDGERQEQAVGEDEAHAGEHALPLVSGRKRLALRHEQREEHERDEERGGVDVEHLRRADGRDQQPRQRRTQQRGRALGALDDRIRLRDDALVLAHELREHEPLGREVRRQEDAEQRDERQQHAEREHAERVQDRHRRHQRRPREVAQEHRPPGAQPRDDGSARDPQHGDRRKLDGEDDPHLRRRARGREDEPRQCQERHLRAERRDHLGRDQRRDRALAQRMGRRRHGLRLDDATSVRWSRRRFPARPRRPARCGRRCAGP